MAKTNGKQPTVRYKGFLHLPHVVTGHADFIRLSGSALKLLIDIAQQYNGRNNGDLCASMTLMRERGWKSNSLLTRKTRELVNKGWIIQTKQGGMGLGPTLYAITWQPIHDCGGKLEVAPTLEAPRQFNRIATPYSGAASTS